MVLHGGAGYIPEHRYQAYYDGCRLAARRGFAMLQQNGSAVDAVEAAIRSMELDKNFNAGSDKAFVSVLHIYLLITTCV